MADGQIGAAPNALGPVPRRPCGIAWWYSCREIMARHCLKQERSSGQAGVDARGWELDRDEDEPSRLVMRLSLAELTDGVRPVSSCLLQDGIRKDTSRAVEELHRVAPVQLEMLSCQELLGVDQTGTCHCIGRVIVGLDQDVVGCQGRWPNPTIVLLGEKLKLVAVHYLHRVG